MVEHSHDIERYTYVDCIGRHGGAEQRLSGNFQCGIPGCVILHDIISSKLRKDDSGRMLSH